MSTAEQESRAKSEAKQRGRETSTVEQESRATSEAKPCPRSNNEVEQRLKWSRVAFDLRQGVMLLARSYALLVYKKVGDVFCWTGSTLHLIGSKARSCLLPISIQYCS